MPTMHERVRTYNDDGLHLFHSGDYVHARETFQAALELAPEDPNLRYNLGQCYERLGRSDQAKKVYEECLQRQPNHADCRQALCVLLVRQGKRDEAVRMVEDWLNREPRLADAYALDGWLWHQAGDLPRAQNRLQQALRFDPHNVHALTELALVYESLRYPDRALALYEQCLDVRPEQPDLVQRVNRLRRQGVGYPKPE
jgi:tetratricopeptide (TPR) repeat protein